MTVMKPGDNLGIKNMPKIYLLRDKINLYFRVAAIKQITVKSIARPVIYRYCLQCKLTALVLRITYMC